MIASILTHYYYSMVDFRGKARYQRGYGAHFTGLKLAPSIHVLSILDQLSFKTHLTSTTFYFFVGT